MSSAGTARPTPSTTSAARYRRLVLSELAEAGYWGMLIDPKYGGQGAPFARFSQFLTRMATLDPMTAGLASVHGCIGAVDPVRTFGNAGAEAAISCRDWPAAKRLSASP